MKIVCLAGGISSERDVSLVTGKNVYEALRRRGHEVILLDVYLGTDKGVEEAWNADIDWAGSVGAISAQNPDIAAVKALRTDGDKNFFGPNVIEICHSADVVFMCLHGAMGEDGKIQAFFDLSGIKYTGTDYCSSAICMNKSLAKELLAYNGVSVPKGIHVYKGDEITNTVGLPCVIKACNGGSSIGVTIARTEEEFAEGIRCAFELDNEAVIEEYIKGREFSVCVLEGKALPIIEIEPLQGFYDYKNKYQSGSCKETCPAELDDILTRKMQHFAEEGFKALRLRGYARLDFLMKEDGTMYCLEANTLPGMTPTSLVPQEAAAIGIGFDELCEKIVETAL
ncbi:MAG: D-alanine--D-alanine ligase [Lachnospiraceae bacterium]|nr:D-alanine--D-alanine ligase [Lachnospiraceae bacterium]